MTDLPHSACLYILHGGFHAQDFYLLPLPARKAGLLAWKEGENSCHHAMPRLQRADWRAFPWRATLPLPSSLGKEEVPFSRWQAAVEMVRGLGLD